MVNLSNSVFRKYQKSSQPKNMTKIDPLLHNDNVIHKQLVMLYNFGPPFKKRTGSHELGVVIVNASQ